MVNEKIALDYIVNIVSDKFGEQTVTKTEIKNDTSSIIFIHDKGTTSPVAFTNSAGELEYENYDENVVHCVLLDSDLIDFYTESPYMLLPYALSGGLVISDVELSRELLSGLIRGKRK